MKKTLTIEFNNDDEAVAVMTALRGIEAGTETTETTESTETKTAEPADTTHYVDSDGMPWNEEIHSGNKGVNADGTWKARKGKADEAKAARAGFLAKGGNVEAPDTTDAPVPGEATREAPTAPAAPSAPTLPADAPAPVTIDELYGEISARMGSGDLTSERLGELYQKYANTTDPAMVGQVLNTNETARANMMAELKA